ncbi:MAG: hypothetical protein AB7E49_09750 [Campylobacterales bacterium]
MEQAARRQKIAFLALAIFLAGLALWSYLARPAPKLPVGPIEIAWPLVEIEPPVIEVEEPQALRQPLAPLKAPALPKADGGKRFFDSIGFPIASGKAIDEKTSGRIQLESGYLNGIDFSELYCRAAAFAGGKPMPKAPAVRRQPFDRLEFDYRPAETALRDLTAIEGVFVLSGELIAQKGVLSGAMSLSLNGPFKNRCGVDETWQQVTLPLRCEASKGKPLSCALELKKLIESLTGVAAKATEAKQKAEIQKLEQDIRKEREKFFKNRVKERPVIEEHDLRPLFLP